jgi:hypothetical protein
VPHDGLLVLADEDAVGGRAVEVAPTWKHFRHLVHEVSPAIEFTKLHFDRKRFGQMSFLVIFLCCGLTSDLCKTRVCQTQFYLAELDFDF